MRGLVLIAAVLPGWAMAQVDGIYALDCAAMGDGRVEVAGDRIAFHESLCELRDPVAVRDMTDAVLFDAECSGEGEVWTKRMLLMPSFEGGLIRVEDGFAVTYARCDGGRRSGF